MILCDMKLILGPYYPIFLLETFENALYYSKQNVPFIENVKPYFSDLAGCTRLNGPV